MTSSPSDVLIVGASAAGLATAEALRRKGYTGSLTMVGAEPQLPYDRPPLSKQVLAGTWEPERARLRPPEVLEERLAARLVLGDPAIRLDVPTRTVSTSAGLSLTADAVVLATGVRPRPLPNQPDLDGVHLLRTIDDATKLRTGLQNCSRLVVVGDGVLGAEVAATARTQGVDVTMVGPQPAPLAAQLGGLVAGLLGDLHRERGVTLRPGAAVTGFASTENRVTGVRLATGETIPADVVVVALGAIPNTEWLDGSGIPVDNGVVCDAHCRAAAGVYAAGDVARWHHDDLDTALRLENRTNATEQAMVVADNILGNPRRYTPVPYFWTDQFDAKLQIHGLPGTGTEVSVVDGDPTEGRFAAVYRRAGDPVGVLGWNMPKQARELRRRLLGEPRAAGTAPAAPAPLATADSSS
ncbi:NAD(P)/FAD-dependent oxidoreductase [Actinoalloteichus hymeniacidonis]|uniref:NAD(P)/FAD-dependent oxidoreductase n=1 Tax=Actinoalloteichus hymeniacidonis TaxID=340345 RepID=UPI00085393BF|nr:FAD/NAD(P)-binding oxidoreductase [Actinoalloteichus hymeniacidonis]MBB5907896.1 NADPH-dependent 2,4-dienoyl-CoA reductase/sulfur reductase-like enzyme [Actinoalloteichus hymeniacidonis]